MKRILLIITCLLLCGCSYVEVENLDIVSSIAVDYKDDNYLLKLEVVQGEDVITYDGEGTSLGEAFESITLSTPNKTYLAHLKSVLFTDSVNLKELVYYFLREEKVNTTFYLLLTDTIDVYQDKFIGDKIASILTNHNVYNFFHIAKRINTNKDFILPFYSNKEIKSGYLFKNSKCVLEVDYDTVEIYKILDNIDGANLHIDDIDISLNNINTKFSFDKYFYVYIYYDIEVIENNSKLKLDDKDISKIENIINDEIKVRIDKFIKLLSNYDVDLFGFSDLSSSWNTDTFKIDIVGHINKKGLLK